MLPVQTILSCREFSKFDSGRIRSDSEGSTCGVKEGGVLEKAPA